MLHAQHNQYSSSRY